MEILATWKKWGGQKRFSLLHWAPLLGAIALMLMVAIVGANALSQLRTSIGWRKHTIQVILVADAFQKNLFNLQQNIREYATTGNTNALVVFAGCSQLVTQQLNQLAEMTRDNPVQQHQLKVLGLALQDVRAYTDRLIDLCQREGPAVAIKADLTGAKNRTVFGRANELLGAFSAEETQLLERRGTAEQSNYHEAERLLVLGSILAMFLLVLANVVASQELATRHRAEAKLNRALLVQKAILHSADYAIVTTDLTGIIQTFNPAAERLLGYAAAELIGRETPMLWRDPEEMAERAAALARRTGHVVSPNFEYMAAKVRLEEVDEGEWTFIRKDGSRFIGSLVVTALTDPAGKTSGFIGIFRDITLRKSMEAERENLIVDLQAALAEVKTLSGLIPICGWCKNVRNDTGYWQSVEQYVRARADVKFTHGICPSCQEKMEADIERANGGKLI